MQPERRDRESIRDIQSQRLLHLLSEIHERNHFWREKFTKHKLDVRSVRSLDDITNLPFTTKSELVQDHSENEPFGSNLTFPVSSYNRMHQTSGTTGRPIRWLDTSESWNWILNCWEQIFRLAGVTQQDRFYFPFSFGPFIGFWAAFDAAARGGRFAIPGGGLSSEARLKAIFEVSATVICCTPTYALRLTEVARQNGIPLSESSVRLIIVAGEPGGNVSSVKKLIENEWGAVVVDHWGMTELGSLATAAIGDANGLYLLETECIGEVLHPETLTPVAAGELGELVITNLGRIGSPLIRYRTGDLVQVSTAPSPIDLHLTRFEGGIQGRADDMVTIRGNNVFPSSVEAVIRQFAEIAEFRITVKTQRSMKHMRIEIEPRDPDATGVLTDRVQRAIKDQLNFAAEVECVSQSSLPRYELKGRRLVIEE